MGIRESLLNTITSVGSSDFVRIVTSAGVSSKATVQNLFKSFETGLGAKSSLTSSDYVRVVGSDNVSYKQLVSGVADVINPLMAKVLSGDHDANTYSTIGLYYCGGWSNQPTGTSAAGYLMVLPHRTNTSYKKQIYSPYSTNDLYIRTMNGGTWTAWEKMPTRAEIDALNSKWTMGSVASVSIPSVNAGLTVDVTIDATKSGYVPRGLLGYAKTGGSNGLLLLSQWYVNGNSLVMRFYNAHTSTVSGCAVSVNVLYEAS